MYLSIYQTQGFYLVCFFKQKKMMSYGLIGMFFFFTAKRMGNIPFQTILQQPLELNIEKMEFHEEHKYLYASCFFVSTCYVKCHFVFLR